MHRRAQLITEQSRPLARITPAVRAADSGHAAAPPANLLAKYPDVSRSNLRTRAYAEFAIESAPELPEEPNGSSLLPGDRERRHQVGMRPLVERLAVA